MSHFSVLVITNSADELAAALQPFHEYECTGIKDDYVVFVPAEESQEAFEKKHKEHLEKYPESTESDLDVFIKEWYGYEKREGVWGRDTNPNPKWDWWVIGGRYSGKLLAKPGAAGTKGRPGLAGSEFDADGIDQCKVGDLDFAAMLERNRRHVTESFSQTYQKLIDAGKNPGTFEQWNAMLAAAAAALKELRAQWEKVGTPGAFGDFINAEKDTGNIAAITLRNAEGLGFSDWFGQTDSLENELAAVAPLSTFAILHDGKWYERGRMGWWGVVHDGKDESEWQSQVTQLLASLPEDKVITVVDCHI